jgi:hypothetical protein
MMGLKERGEEKEISILAFLHMYMINYTSTLQVVTILLPNKCSDMFALNPKPKTNTKWLVHSWSTFGARTSHGQFGLTRLTTAQTWGKPPLSPL